MIDEIILYYDAWSKKHQISLYCCENLKFLYPLRLQVTCINLKLLSCNLLQSPIPSALPGPYISLGSLFSHIRHPRASTNITEKLKSLSGRSGEKKTLLIRTLDRAASSLVTVAAALCSLPRKCAYSRRSQWPSAQCCRKL